MIRHRAIKQTNQSERQPAASYNETDSSHHRRQRTLHISVWLRVFSIVGIFSWTSYMFSWRRRNSVSFRKQREGDSVSGGGSHLIHNPRFVTVVMPSVVRPEARPERLANIAKTWGPNSRAVYIVHSADEYPDAAQNLVSKTSNNDPYPQQLLVPKNISIDMGVQRLDHVIRTVHSDIDPDFAFFVNDHTFVVPDNLCKFLKDRDSSIDLYAGHALKGNKETVFNSGAAGYVLSRSTMEKLIEEWDKPNSKCSASGASKWIQGNPGLLTAQCFVEVLKIPVLDTRDNNLSHVFHAFGLVRSVTGKVDQWYLNKHDALDGVFGVDKVHHHKPQDGAMCCSSSTITFHYVEGPENLALWKILETVHSEPTITTDKIIKLMIEIWPVRKHELGFYSHSLPTPDSKGWWNEIVEVVRKIAIEADPQKSC